MADLVRARLDSVNRMGAAIGSLGGKLEAACDSITTALRAEVAAAAAAVERARGDLARATRDRDQAESELARAHEEKQREMLAIKLRALIRVQEEKRQRLKAVRDAQKAVDEAVASLTSSLRWGRIDAPQVARRGSLSCRDYATQLREYLGGSIS